MELLVVTLAHIIPGKDVDGLARIRLISDTVRNAPGLVLARFYRSRGNESYYFILTTWESEESWRKVDTRYNPRQLLLGSATELLTDPPEQWLMHYLWGYSRPAATPILAAAHLATIRPDQAERTQRGWIEGLRRQTMQPLLAFAFLARGDNEEAVLVQQPPLAAALYREEGSLRQGAIFLNMVSWASETDREEFYVDPHYQAISLFLSNVGVSQVLALEPL